MTSERVSPTVLAGADPNGPSLRRAAPWFGRRWEHRQAIVAGVGSVAACWIYRTATVRWAPDAVPGPVEFWATATSLWSVWITQRRNVLALPIGIVSVVLMGWFFHDIALYGQMLLQWGYYIPAQLWAWAEWTRGGEDRTELTVTTLSARGRALTGVALVVGTVILGQVLDAGWGESLYTYWDASIVAASILAMFLMARKKVESWWFWIIPVDLSAIGLYVRTGANMFAALYVLFLVMAVIGLVKWQRAARAGTA